MDVHVRFAEAEQEVLSECLDRFETPGVDRASTVGEPSLRRGRAYLAAGKWPQRAGQAVKGVTFGQGTSSDGWKSAVSGVGSGTRPPVAAHHRIE